MLFRSRLAVLGFAFKADTGDTRESPAIGICRQLLDERAVLVIHDPQARENARRELGDVPAGAVTFAPDAYQAAAGAHALVFLTDWEQYRELDFRRIFAGMARPAFLFDGRNFLSHSELYEIGFNVFPVGKPALSHLSA